METLSYELAFWGDCLNTWEEEQKQQVYAPLMGLDIPHVGGVRVIDIGSGPTSLLLKMVDRSRKPQCAVVDPLMDQFPRWVRSRYWSAGIDALHGWGEQLPVQSDAYDEAWIYNVLQHVEDPQAVIAEAKRVARRIRLFEWVGIPAYAGHPHELDWQTLTGWLMEDTEGGQLRTVVLSECGCFGDALAGVVEVR